MGNGLKIGGGEKDPDRRMETASKPAEPPVRDSKHLTTPVTSTATSPLVGTVILIILLVLMVGTVLLAWRAARR